MSTGSIKKPITGTAINELFGRGNSISAYSGMPVYDVELEQTRRIPRLPKRISYSDFLNKAIPIDPYPSPVITITKQPKNKFEGFNTGNTQFTVQVSVDWQQSDWPTSRPAPTNFVTEYQWQVSTNGGTSWSDTGTNSNQLTVSTVNSNDNNLYRVAISAELRAPDSDSIEIAVASTTVQSQTAKLNLSTVVYDPPAVSFFQTLRNETLVIEKDAAGIVTQDASGSVDFSGTGTPYSVVWPSIPASRNGGRSVSYEWQFNFGSGTGFITLTSSSLPSVSLNQNRNVNFTNIDDRNYDDYHFRLKVTATQTLVSPSETLSTVAYSNTARLTVNETVDNQATLLSVATNGPVTDRLDQNSSGPTFTLRTSKAVGKQVYITSSNNTGQIGQVLQSGFNLTVTSDVMTFGLGSNGSTGLLGKLRDWRPTGDTIMVQTVGAGWEPASVNDNYTILNDNFSGSLSRVSRSVDEGQDITGSVMATDLQNTNWSWELAGFSVGGNSSSNDVPSASGSLPLTFQGQPRFGNYVGTFSIPTWKDPGNPTSGERTVKSTGTLRIRNQAGTLFAQRSITINEFTSVPSVPSIISSRNESVSNSSYIISTFYTDGSATSSWKNPSYSVKNFTWGTIPLAEVGEWLIFFRGTTQNIAGYNSLTVNTDAGSSVDGGKFFRTKITGVPLTRGGQPIVPQDTAITTNTIARVYNKFDNTINDEFTIQHYIFISARYPDGTFK